jgi:hypothetical protein
MLTFITSRLLVTFDSTASATSKSQQPNENLAHIIAYANRSTSRAQVLVFFVLCCLWLYQLLLLGVILLALTSIGGFIAYTIYNAGVENPPEELLHMEPNETSTALVTFQEKAGFDPSDMFRRTPPWVLISAVAVVWFNFLSLVLYIVAHAARSFAKLLLAPAPEVVVRRETVVITAAVPDISVQQTLKVD